MAETLHAPTIATIDRRGEQITVAAEPRQHRRRVLDIRACLGIAGLAPAHEARQNRAGAVNAFSATLRLYAAR
jgi:hypothetical protein